MFEQPLTIPKDNRFPSGREAFIRVAALLGQAKQAGRACSAISDFPSPVLARQLQPSQLDTKCWAGRQSKQERRVRGRHGSYPVSSVSLTAGRDGSDTSASARMCWGGGSAFGSSRRSFSASFGTVTKASRHR